MYCGVCATFVRLRSGFGAVSGVCVFVIGCGNRPAMHCLHRITVIQPQFELRQASELILYCITSNSMYQTHLTIVTTVELSSS